MTEIDGEILGRAKRGDARAFAMVVEYYHARCLRFAQQMLLSAEDAEEAVQDAFVRVYDSLPRYDESLRFEPWLFRILANRCRTARARRRRHESYIAYGELPANVGVPPDGGDAARDELWRLLDRLPTEQREAFLLHHIEGMPYEDMVTITGAGVSALKMRVKRATDALRARLAGVSRG